MAKDKKLKDKANAAAAAEEAQKQKQEADPQETAGGGIFDTVHGTVSQEEKAASEAAEPAAAEAAEAAASPDAAEAGPAAEADAAAAAPETPPAPPEDETAKKLAATEDQLMRLAAEYANYRKRTAKEKEAIWADAKVQAVAAILPVYDNLERALKQTTADTAYQKGVEMTMKGLQDALNGLGVEKIPSLGETFDPKYHNAVMHVEDESVGENTIVDVFQQGFQLGDKVIRFAMVKVAN